MTPGKYNELVLAYYRRVRREREVAATWICTLVNHFPMRGKNARTLKVEQLIGYSEDQLKEIRARQAAARAQQKKD